MSKGNPMNSFQTQTKLEQLHREAQMNHALEPIREQHLKSLYMAIRTLFLELRALTIGNLELTGKVQVQKHV
jgi:hypothetical protein